jgi:hypothetical protein
MSVRAHCRACTEGLARMSLDFMHAHARARTDASSVWRDICLQEHMSLDLARCANVQDMLSASARKLSASARKVFSLALVSLAAIASLLDHVIAATICSSNHLSARSHVSLLLRVSRDESEGLVLEMNPSATKHSNATVKLRTLS